MTRKEVEHIKRVLKRVKDSDGHIAKAIAICDKQLAHYDSMRGQLKDSYDDADFFKWGGR